MISLLEVTNMFKVKSLNDIVYCMFTVQWRFCLAPLSLINFRNHSLGATNIEEDFFHL